MRKNRYLPHKLAKEANCFLGDIKTKVTRLSVSSIFRQHSRSYTESLIWGLSTFYVSRIISPKWAESYCYKINRKSNICSSDCKYGINFIHKYFFSLLFIFSLDLFQALNFVGFVGSNPNWDFQPVYTAGHITFLWFWATLDLIDINVRATILRQFFLIKK